MDLIFQQAIPYKSLAFIHQYLRLHRTLSNPKRLKYFLPVFTIVFFKSAHYVFLTAFPPQTTANKLFHADITQLVNLPPITNFILTANILLSGYFIALNYLDEKSCAYVVTTIDELFVKEKTKLLISLYKSSGLTVFEYIQSYGKRVLLFLQFFILAVDFVIIVSQLVGIWLFLNELPSSTFSNKLFIFLVGEVNVCTFYIVLYTFCYAHILQGALAFILLEAVRLLLEQLQRRLINFTRDRKKNKETKVLLLYQQAIYRHEYTKAVVTITSGNHYLGVAFVPLLLVNCPANALLTIVLLTWNLVFGARFILLMLMLQQFICIFVIHSLVAHLNDRLTMLAKMFIPFIYADRSFSYVSTLKQKLFNCLFLSSFYTVNPVGFTYYTFGRFSMLNFVKVHYFIILFLVFYSVPFFSISCSTLNFC